MNDPERRSRVLFAQAFAAVAYFVVVHGAHAATILQFRP